MTSEIAVRDDAVGLPSLSDGPNPAAAVAYAAQVSSVIASVLDKGNGYEVIQGKKHVTIEGWQSIAAMTGHSVEVEWSRVIDGIEPDNGLNAWESRAIVRDQHGRQVASGESMADPNERVRNKQGQMVPPPWARAQFSIRSMAQTRAMSRAMASRLRYIVQLAGFSGTPAEEMGHDDTPKVDPVQVARQRFKVLVEALEVNSDAVMAELGDDPTRLTDDAFFAKVAYAIGYGADSPDLEIHPDDEVVEGQESLDVGPEPRREDVA